MALCLAPTAGAVTFSSGKVSLSFSQKFAKALKSSKTKVKGTQGTKVKGRKATFVVRSGKGTLASPYSASLTLGGTLGFKRGGRSVSFKKLAEAVKGKSGSFKSGKSTIFSEATKGKVASEAGFTGLDVRGARLKLTKSGAKTLNRKLHTTKFKRNMTAGTLSGDAERSVTFLNGNTRVAIDNGTDGKLQACGVTLSAVAPATSTPPPPNRIVNLPISGGTVTAKAPEGTIVQAGGLHLSKTTGTPHEADLTQFEISFFPTGGSFSAIASDVGGARVPIGPVDRTGQTVQPQYTATGGTLTLVGGTLRLSGQAAALLAANFGCSTLAANDPLGTLEQLTGQVQ